MRKKVDERIRTMVENGVKGKHRSLFVIIGDKGPDQVVNIHYILTKATVKACSSVLWFYNKEIFLSSHKKKCMKQLKKMMHRGLLDPEKDDPFSLFVTSTEIRYYYYAETENILGNTYGMCVPSVILRAQMIAVVGDAGQEASLPDTVLRKDQV